MMNDTLKKLIVVGDRLLVKPSSLSDKTKGGLFLPPGYKEKEEIQTGYIIKVGPGYPIPMPSEDMDEPWKNSEEKLSIFRYRQRKEIRQSFFKKEQLK